MFSNYWLHTKTNWQRDWSSGIFRAKFALSFAVGIAILFIFPHFFQYIQQRTGYQLSDPLLGALPATDVSVPIFLCIWSSAAVLIVRAVQHPRLMLKFVTGYVLLTLTRFATIWLLPLEPPVGLIELTDPLSNYFYGPNYITKDLFFSGHTSTQLLIFYCLQQPRERVFTLLGACMIGLLVLVQHVHYTIDVLAVPFFTYTIQYMAGWWTQKASPSVK